MTQDAGSRLLVVGASLAGLRAVEAARAAGHAGPITLVGAEEHLPYDRPPLSKQVLGPGAADPEPYRPRAEYDDLGVELVLGRVAVALDPGARTVTLGGDTGPGAPGALGYDALVIATGAEPRALPGVEGPHPRGVQALRTRDDALALRAALDEGDRVVVVGAGFIGLEVASATRARGADVTVVEAADRPLARSVGGTAADLLVGLVRRAGVDLRVGRTLTALEARDGRLGGVRLDDDQVLAAERLVVGVGAVPATGWLEGSGLEVDDGLLCDATLQTSQPGIWAAGDVARVEGRRLEHWTAAHDEGRVAGANAAAWLQGAEPRPVTGVPYVWSDVFGSRLQLLGEGHDADAVEVVGDPEGPWLVLYGRAGGLAGVLGLDLPGRVMKFRGPLLRGASLAEAAQQARSKPLPARATP